MKLKKTLGLTIIGLFLSACGPEQAYEEEEKLVFENPSQQLNLGQDESNDYIFHRIYNYYSDATGWPYVSVYASYIDPGLIYSSYPLYIWEHPFYTQAFMLDAYGLNDDDY